MNSLPKTVTRPRRDCDLNPGPAPESSTLTASDWDRPSARWCPDPTGKDQIIQESTSRPPVEACPQC